MCTARLECVVKSKTRRSIQGSAENEIDLSSSAHVSDVAPRACIHHFCPGCDPKGPRQPISRSLSHRFLWVNPNNSVLSAILFFNNITEA